jgi:hypothetical protein
MWRWLRWSRQARGMHTLHPRPVPRASVTLACVLTIRGGGLRNESTVRAMQEAMAQAEKHESSCEVIAALMAEARAMLEQARAPEAERVREAAEEAGAPSEVAAAVERQRLEEEMASLALRMQQVQAQLGVVPPAAPAPFAGYGGDTVRGRTLLVRHGAVYPHVRVRGVHPAAAGCASYGPVCREPIEHDACVAVGCVDNERIPECSSKATHRIQWCEQGAWLPLSQPFLAASTPVEQHSEHTDTILHPPAAFIYFVACSRSSSSIRCAAMRSAASLASGVSCLAACCVRSLFAAAFRARAARSSSRNTCAAWW